MGATLTVRAQLADISARVTTIGMARAMIGHATEVLSNGYAQLTDVTGAADLADEARGLLDVANAYAQKVYAGLPSDIPSQGFELTVQQRLRVAEVVRESAEAAAAVEDATQVSVDIVAGFRTVLEAAGGVAGQALSLGGGGVFVLLWAFVRAAWPVLLVVVLAIVVLHRFRSRALTAIKEAVTG